MVRASAWLKERTTAGRTRPSLARREPAGLNVVDLKADQMSRAVARSRVREPFILHVMEPCHHGFIGPSPPRAEQLGPSPWRRLWLMRTWFGGLDEASARLAVESTGPALRVCWDLGSCPVRPDAEDDEDLRSDSGRRTCRPRTWRAPTDVGQRRTKDSRGQELRNASCDYRSILGRACCTSSAAHC